MKKEKMESQNIEYKESWRDEYLKWVCGFANASGGKIYIGIKDNGEVCGVKNAKKLLEDLPNMIRDTVGVIADVNLHTKNKKDFIEIIVPQTSYPVNYRGEYHYRSGTTKQLLQGSALTQFLLKKTGMHWDAVTVDKISIEDLDKESFDIFRREAKRSGRMTSEELSVSDEELLDKLELIENGKLTRAAVLLFYRKPERIFSGAYIKIGFFEGSEIRYMDDLTGSLFIQADRIIDLIYLKYMKAYISYYKETRVETYLIPREAVREAVYNAIMHADYSSCNPIQIRISEEEMYISNNSVLPQGWTAETFMQPHRSEAYNPLVAMAFYRAGYVEKWGRGIKKICDICKEENAPLPEYSVLPISVMVRFPAKPMPENVAENNADVVDNVVEKLPVKLSVRLPVNESVEKNDTVNCTPNCTVNENVPQDVSQSVLKANDTINQSVEKNGTVNDTLNDTINDTLIKFDVKKLSKTEMLVLEKIKIDSYLTMDDIEKNTGLSRRTVARAIKELQEMNILKRIGARKNGHWEIVESEAEK